MKARKAVAWMTSGAAAVGTAFGLMTGPAPASAAPGPTGATLHIIQDPQNQGNYLLAILGRFPMPEADTNITVHVWCTNVNASLPPVRLHASIFYTTAAPNAVVIPPQTRHLVEVDPVRVGCHSVTDEVVQPARDVQPHAMREVTAMGQIQPEHRVIRFEHGQVNGHVRLGT